MSLNGERKKRTSGNEEAKTILQGVHGESVRRKGLNAQGQVDSPQISDRCSHSLILAPNKGIVPGLEKGSKIAYGFVKPIRAVSAGAPDMQSTAHVSEQPPRARRKQRRTEQTWPRS